MLDRLFESVTKHSRVTIAVLLVLTVVVGAGAPMVDQSSSLDQFESDSEAAEKQAYIAENFTTERDDTTPVQVILRGDGVLSKDALVNTLELQQRLRENETVGPTLANETPTSGIANFIATASIQQEKGAKLQAQATRLQQKSRQLNRTAAGLGDALNKTRRLQGQYDALNQSYEQGAINQSTYTERASNLKLKLDQARRNAVADLNGNQTATFTKAFEQTRALQSELAQLEVAREQGAVNESTYQQRTGEIQSQFQQVYQLGTRGVLKSEFEALQQQSAELQERKAAMQSGSMPSLDEQLAQLQSMNESQIDAVTKQVLSENATGMASQAINFMPKTYEPGSTEANATMLIVFQQQGGQTVQGMASTDIVESQTALQTVAKDSLEGDAIVFGSGIISEEMDQSMADSLAIVGPLALLFVLLALLVAYRDLLDIVLGVFGIVAVLVWTFGFMGWADITFNQMFIAVPVLLIGLSIDYAIHVFMRHREEREEHPGEDVRGSMRVALVSVGAALTWVTATTVIGFLSNLVSPLPPIQDFGVVSSVGILSALVVFGGLIPALKLEIDGFLENHGFDRKKRAFGTGGGVLGRALSTGAVAARKAPFVVIALTLVVSSVGAYGATQVDTSFSQEEFLAEDPPGWMKELPEPFKPGSYSAKANMEYVNENFQNENSEAQFLLQDGVADDDALQKVADLRERAAEKEDVVFLNPNGNPSTSGPLSVMRQVAASNESFNATFTAADADGDGVPDRNVEQVYDALFATAPSEAESVIHRDDGEYRALKMSIAINGGASSTAVKTQMEDVAAGVEGLDATATGQQIVFEIIQQQLLDTVIQSLVITMVAVFGFLMIVYRLTEGSATLGAVTLMPVLFSVTWILGTMYLIGMSFNVLTGMITSLTIGLGVAYSIHLSERFNIELERRGSVWEALDVALTGTGGALLGSAATTVGGFGVLAFAILPTLQQFGIITGLTIVYAFLASVFVLPSLLVVWTRYLGPGARGAVDTKPTETAPSAGED